MGTLKLGIYSVGAGLVASGLALGISAIFDHITDPRFANFIGIFIAMFVNFLMQQYVFTGSLKGKQLSFLFRYALTDVLILGSNQLIFNYMIHHKKKFQNMFTKKYYNTVCRMLIGTVIWVLFSFPLRRYWVFA